MHNVNLHRREIHVGSRTITLETGKLAKQADGAVIVRSGDTVVLVTACRAASAREGIDFLPLTVDYREYTYASGRIPGGFFKREGKPTDKEVLTSRLIDRPIRPLFAAGWRYETQVIALLLSADTENDSDVLAITGASAALALSSIPFQKTIAGVRVGMVDGQFVINPTFAQRKESTLDLDRRGQHGRHRDGGSGRQGGVRSQRRCRARRGPQRHQADHRRHRCARGERRQEESRSSSGRRSATSSIVRSKRKSTFRSARRCGSAGSSRTTIASIRCSKSWLRRFPRAKLKRRSEAKQIFHELKEKVLRDEVLERGHRLDGRKFDEIRPIWCEAGVLPRTHGSVVFTRGETQALVTCTLGTADDEQKVEHVSGEFYKRFMLHYNFPPFSVGEVAFLRGPGRREVGHGALAERALAAVVPSEDKFAYTIRIVSDILESNGSSSMASVCGGSMAMMDAGVPLKAAGGGHRDGSDHGREDRALRRALGHCRR